MSLFAAVLYVVIGVELGVIGFVVGLFIRDVKK